MGKTAFLFPGQGSQAVGMGAQIHGEYDVAREIFDMASDISRIDLAKLCFRGPLEELTQTVNLQPAITAVNLACLAALRKEGAGFDFTAGHSLGEYSALVASGAVAPDDAVRMVCRRGELMQRAAAAKPGEMHAVVGLNIEAVESVTEKWSGPGVVEVANHNTETQVVISGTPAAVAATAEKTAEKGARVKKLNVSGAWHCRLMAEVEPPFAEFLESIPFQAAETPIIQNVTAETTTGPEVLRRNMARQLLHRVRWYDSMRKLLESGVDTFVEVGNGKVLSGILRKILPKNAPATIYAAGDMKGLERYLQAAG